MPGDNPNALDEERAIPVIVRKYIGKDGIKLKNVLRCSQYVLGSLVCFAVLGYYFQNLGFLNFVIGLLGIILLERSIFVFVGMQTR